MVRQIERLAATAPSLQPYQYENLDTTQQQIRLFRTVQGKSKNITGRLKVFTIGHEPQYQALSYTWGAEHPAFPVVVAGDAAISIRQNLHQFLRVWRGKRAGGWIWIDQICIDQGSVTERNHQVRLMAKIYQRATRVIVWLNPKHEDGHVVRRMFSNPYWSRMWIVQEVLLARDRVIFYGWKELQWDMSSREIGADTKASSTKPPGDLEILTRNNSRAEQLMRDTVERVHSHSHLLQAYMTHQCSDARDRIYALYAFIPEDQKPVVDYNKSVRQVFLEAVRMLVKSSPLENMSEGERNVKEAMFTGLDLAQNMNLAVDRTQMEELYNRKIRPAKGFYPGWNLDKERLVVALEEAFQVCVYQEVVHQEGLS